MTASSTSGVSASDKFSPVTRAESVGTSPPEDSQQRVSQFLRQLQDQISTSLTQLDGLGTFQEDDWERPEGGGGRSRVMRDGAVFEQGGVGFSEVWGDKLPPSILQQRPEAEGHGFYATGTSLVLHPRNPHVPTVHLNYRYFEAGPVWWFGGGADLTPYYPEAEDAIHFHRTLKQACDRHHPEYYPTFKRWCDEYFYLKHRQETRGIGGIFFDYQDGQVGELYRSPATPQGAASFGGNDSSGARIGGNPPDFAPQNRLGTPGPAATYSAQVGELQPRSWEDLFGFVRSCGEAFLPAYVPIVERRHSMAYGDRERHFQLYRRGRYVEFNLVYDRGTIFGLQTNGRTESILMSLPPLVRWEYGYQPEPNTPEAELYKTFLKPQDWLSPDPL